MQHTKEATQQLARLYADRGDPDGWFEEFYTRAGGDITKVYWADLKPNPLLLDWVEANRRSTGYKAVIVGCGLGDDAEALAATGYQVTAFDIAGSAIEMCMQRFPESLVDYQVADLFRPPTHWRHSFDLVYECNTVQILTGVNRQRAIQAITGLVAPEGHLIVSCRSRLKTDDPDAFPIPLDREEIEGFVRAGLTETAFLSYNDDQNPPVPHYFAVYRRLLSS